MYQIYEIMDNDTIDSLAVRINTTIDELERINGKIDFKTGNMIVIPNTNDLYYTYVIKNGDTLYNISKLYNQDVNLLYKINGIKEGEYIYPGEEIIIPKSNVNAYIVKDGDTLNNVAEKMKINSEEIIKSNDNIFLLPEQLIIHKN